MKDYSNFLTEKPYSCSVEGCSMKFNNEDHLTVHKKRHDMILTLGLGPKGTTDQTPTPTQFIRNCEEVGLFQDLQNVNPFEETFKKAVEAVKSGQLSLEKSFQSNQPDDTLHTPNIFPHITDVSNVNQTDICHKAQNIPPCEEELLRQDDCDGDKIDLEDVASTHSSTETVLSQTKNENIVPLNNVNGMKNNFPGEKKIMVNISEGHLLQLLPPQDSQSSCNMVFIKNTVGNEFSPSALSVKEKLKKNLNEKKTGKNLSYKVPILKCPIKRPTNSNGNKFSKFSKNAKKLISKLDISEVVKVNEITSTKQKNINKVQSKESRSEFLARSRAASFRCREKKKMYLLYLEKINSELSTANQNLILINSLLRQEINDLRRELMKHKNCNVPGKNTGAASTTAPEANLITERTLWERDNISKVQPSSQSASKIVHDRIMADCVHAERTLWERDNISKVRPSSQSASKIVHDRIMADRVHSERTLWERDNISKVRPSSQSGSKIVHDPIMAKGDCIHSEELIPLESSTCHSEASLFSFDVAEVILNSEPEESEIPLNEGNKPPDIIVRFNSVSNDSPATLPFDSCIDRYIERAGESVKQIYGEHSYYLKKLPVDIDKRILNYKTFRGHVDPQINSEECKKLSALQIQIQQNDPLGDLTSLNSRVLIGPRTPPPLILLKPFKKRSLQSKRNEKT